MNSSVTGSGNRYSSVVSQRSGQCNPASDSAAVTAATEYSTAQRRQTWTRPIRKQRAYWLGGWCASHSAFIGSRHCRTRPARPLHFQRA